MAILHQSEKKTIKGKLVYAIFVLLLILYFPMICFPMVYTFTNSLKTGIEIASPIPTFIPKDPQWQTYVKIFTEYNYGQNIANSFYLCITIILLQVSISALAAYALSILKPPGSRLVFLLFSSTMMISGPAIMFPLYVMIAQAGLINTFASIILPCSVWAYSILLFKGFFDGIPKDLIEAAEIDGAGAMYIFLKILIPISKPVFVVNIVNTFVSVYNDVGMHTLFLQTKEKWPLMVRMQSIIAGGGSAEIGESFAFAMSMVSIIPVLIMYIIFQKHIAQGITMTGLKG